MEILLVGLVVSTVVLSWIVFKFRVEIVGSNSMNPKEADDSSIAANTFLELLEGETDNSSEPIGGVIAVPISEDLGSNLVMFFGNEIELSKQCAGNEVIQKVPSQLAQIAVGSDSVLKTAIGVAEQQGVLVRLTKESSAAWKAAQKVRDGNGAVLGVLKNSNGRFSHVVRFNPASSISAVSSLTGLINSMAMQAQLAAIEKAIAEVSATTRRIEAVQWNLVDSEMQAVSDLLKETYLAASSCGILTDVMWDQIQGIALIVKKYEHFTINQLNGITNSVNTLRSYKQKRTWFKENQGRLHENLVAAELSTQMSAQYAALRIWRLAATKDPSLDHYFNDLQIAIANRHQAIGNLHDEMRLALEKASEKTHKRIMFVKFDSKTLRQTLEEIHLDFEQISGQRWTPEITLTRDELSE